MAITLKMARVGAGLTQAQMAEKMGVHVQTIAKYEKEPYKMSVLDVFKYCEICGVRFDDIFLLNDPN